MIEVDQYKSIRHLYTVEGLSQREIAKRLNISRNTVAKYCKGSNLPQSKPRNRSKQKMNKDVENTIKGYLEEDKLAFEMGARKQQHTAKRIFDRLKVDKGLEFQGSYESVAKVVRQLRQEPGEVFLPLEWDPGDAMQVDWGEAKVKIDDQLLRGHMFCTRLCYSAMPFVVLFPAERNEFFLEGHRRAFEFYKKVPRRVIYDNLRTAVKEGWGRYVTQKQPALKLLEAHYSFASEFCNRGKGNEKGLVEGLVGWIRRNFLTPIPEANSWEEINVSLAERCINYLDHTIRGRSQTVGAEYVIELKKMLPLPNMPFETCRIQHCQVYESSLIRIDNNYYSVPAWLIKKLVTVKAYPFHLEIWLNGEEIDSHKRHFGAGNTIYKLEHYLDALEHKPRAVRQAKPVRQEVHYSIRSFRDYLIDGPEGDREFVQILRLFVKYGQAPLLNAIKECTNKATYSYEAVRFILMQNLQSYSEVATAMELDRIGPEIIYPDLTVYDGLLHGGERR